MFKKFGCGHRGLGKTCHRCLQADALEAKVPAGKTPQWAKDEATRLRAVPKKSAAAMTMAEMSAMSAPTQVS